MDIKNYAKVTALNFLLVVIGALVGPAIVHIEWFPRIVHAQSPPPSAAAKADVATPQRDTGVEYVSPTISAGSALFGTVLAHRVATDGLIVNDYEVLKLYDNLVNILISKRVFTVFEARSVADAAKAARPLRVEPPPTPAPTPAAKP